MSAEGDRCAVGETGACAADGFTVISTDSSTRMTNAVRLLWLTLTVSAVNSMTGEFSRNESLQ
jgi:hypothetical protein